MTDKRKVVDMEYMHVASTNASKLLQVVCKKSTREVFVNKRQNCLKSATKERRAV